MVPVLHAFTYAIDQRMIIDQLGYRTAAKKICVVASPQTGYNAPNPFVPASTYQLRRSADDAVVFTGPTIVWNNGAVHSQSGDLVWRFDFTAFTTPGTYYVFDPVNQKGSYTFEINDGVYAPILRAATRMFFYQRCGQNIDAAHGGAWTHGVCHQGARQDLDCRSATDPNNAATSKNLSGGWHDAGDYNKYVNFTYGVMHNLLFAYQEHPDVFTDAANNIPESGNGISDLLDEIKYELDWLVKMQQADGSVLSKVSVANFEAGSPPTADGAARLYGAASTSSTLTVASVFAHAAVVFKSLGNADMTAYGNSLLTKAAAAWAWAGAYKAVFYNNAGIQSSNPEVAAYDVDARFTCAAAMLFGATGDAVYKTYVENNYTAIHAYAWNYWYPFENTYQDIILYYTSLPGVSPAVATNIRQSFLTSMNMANPELLIAYNQQLDPYGAYLKDGAYTWGSNQTKSSTGQMFFNVIKYGLSPSNTGLYKDAAEGYIHYLHGVNPNCLAMLTNLDAMRKENGATAVPAHFAAQMYHSWMGDGTVFKTNPAPGYVTGGANPQYAPDASYGGRISPPQDQPIQKAYKDWNVSYPQDSWQITEPAIYYQAAYIRLLANFVGKRSSTPTEEAPQAIFVVYPNPAKDRIFITATGAPVGKAVAEIIDEAGRVLKRQELTNAPTAGMQVFTGDLQNGMYVAKITMGDLVQTVRFVKE